LWKSSPVGAGGARGCAHIGVLQARCTDTLRLVSLVSDRTVSPNVVRSIRRACNRGSAALRSCASHRNSTTLTAARRGRTDLLLRSPLADSDMRNWKAFERAIQAGPEHTVVQLDELPEDSPLWRRAG
jgi:hypothetical protein